MVDDVAWRDEVIVEEHEHERQHDWHWGKMMHFTAKLINGCMLGGRHKQETLA